MGDLLRSPRQLSGTRLAKPVYLSSGCRFESGGGERLHRWGVDGVGRACGLCFTLAVWSSGPAALVGWAKKKMKRFETRREEKRRAEPTLEREDRADGESLSYVGNIVEEVQKDLLQEETHQVVLSFS
ncbi:hypothetical protein Sjap_004269 [Stephania japonica]|uniref:Uncharacterized protein n=1 Tax=Stephania japonica TaxID=461633 RepID=A0AAP0K291_9MAGN